MLGRVTHETLDDWWPPIIGEHELEPSVSPTLHLVRVVAVSTGAAMLNYSVASS